MKPTIMMYPLPELPKPGETFCVEGQVWVVTGYLREQGAWDGLLLARKPNGYRKWLFGYIIREGKLMISEPLLPLV